MSRIVRICCFVLATQALWPASKPHVVAFGKWMKVKCFIGEDESKPVEVKIRPLLIDGGPKEFIVSAAHEVTDRTFVVQRMYRVNDSLPEEAGAVRWQWQRGGWLLVNRITAKLQPISLPAFDPYYSSVSWFRDYAAYCGLSDDGRKMLAIVAQLGKRKPLLKKSIEDAPDSATPESACSAPTWQRVPARVTFAPANGQNFTFTVRSRSVDLSSDENEGEE